MNELKVIDRREVLGKQFTMYGDFDNPLFLARDVAAWIDHSQADVMIRPVDASEKALKIVQTPGGNQEAWFLTEDGLYEVLMLSRKPIAREFKNEVKLILRSVRKHGAYFTSEKLEEVLLSPDTLIKLASNLKEEQQKRMEEERKRKVLEARVEADKPFTDFARSLANSKGSVPIGDFAKAICNSGINIGRNRLFQWLRDMGYLMHDNFPYQRFINKGLFQVKEYTVWTAGGEIPRFTTLVTGKGQLVLLKALQEDWCAAM